MLELVEEDWVSKAGSSKAPGECWVSSVDSTASTRASTCREGSGEAKAEDHHCRDLVDTWLPPAKDDGRDLVEPHLPPVEVDSKDSVDARATPADATAWTLSRVLALVVAYSLSVSRA